MTAPTKTTIYGNLEALTEDHTLPQSRWNLFLSKPEEGRQHSCVYVNYLVESQTITPLGLELYVGGFRTEDLECEVGRVNPVFSFMQFNPKNPPRFIVEGKNYSLFLGNKKYSITTKSGERGADLIVFEEVFEKPEKYWELMREHAWFETAQSDGSTREEKFRRLKERGILGKLSEFAVSKHIPSAIAYRAYERTINKP